MFANLAALFAFAALVAAVPAPAPWGKGPTGPSVSQCNTGAQQCCDSVQDASDPSVQNLLGSLGLGLGSVTGQVGVTCTPVTVIGTGSGADCSAQPVCCEGNNFNGLIAIGCSPININL